MEGLDLYLDEFKPTPKTIGNINDCCLIARNIELSPNLLLYVCVECATVKKEYMNIKDYYERFKNPNIVKTYIPYSNKFRHLHRLNKWQNYSYKEVQLHKLLTEIDNKLKGYDREIVDFTKIFFSQIYDKLAIRAKIKDALIVYCLYKSSILFKKELEIDDLLKLFNITIKNYNDLNKKLKSNKLFYLKEMNEYIKLSNYDIDKNRLIQQYNLFLEYNKGKFNNKSILLGLIYFISFSKEDFIKKDFFDTFNISKSSIKNVEKFIKTNKII